MCCMIQWLVNNMAFFNVRIARRKNHHDVRYRYNSIFSLSWARSMLRKKNCWDGVLRQKNCCQEKSAFIVYRVFIVCTRGYVERFTFSTIMTLNQRWKINVCVSWVGVEALHAAIRCSALDSVLFNCYHYLIKPFRRLSGLFLFVGHSLRFYWQFSGWPSQ